MELEHQVCNLEQAKELAGLLGDHAPESLWFWKYGNYGRTKEEWHINDRSTYPFNAKGRSPYDCETYRAYTGDELGVLLPSEIKCKNTQGFYDIYKFPTGFGVGYRTSLEEGFNELIGFEQKHEAWGKADLLIKGVKEGWIKPEDLKL